MSWFEKIIPSKIKTIKRQRSKSVPEGVWVNCPECKSHVYKAEIERNLFVCVKCNHHMRIGARDRLNQFLDNNSYYELFSKITSVDPFNFKDTKNYKDRLIESQKASGENNALLVMEGTLNNIKIVACAFEFKFLGGSMGSAVGEKFVRAVDHSIKKNAPLICFSSSGGARMQEAFLSLMQLAKTTSALVDLAAARIPFISVLTNPTTGGVSASIAMLGDINIAEPGALIGFAGPRVIQQTVGEQLPEDFQRSQFLLEKGALDMIVDRREMRETITGLIQKLTQTESAKQH
jgi:acetyl-CoA carboxylase carboxyl transferase subunit beta